MERDRSAETEVGASGQPQRGDRGRQRAHQQFRGELAEFKGQQLQLLGLLAAIVSFIVTAGNIANQTGGVD